MNLFNPSGLEIRNDFSELRRMSNWIQETGMKLGLPPSLLFDLDLCANEVVTNIIDYAYEDHACHAIRLYLAHEDCLVSLEIQDDGLPFNPLETPPVVHATTLEDAKVGGLGVQLVRSLMSDSRYSRRNGQNILTLRVNFAPVGS